MQQHESGFIGQAEIAGDRQRRLAFDLIAKYRDGSQVQTKRQFVRSKQRPRRDAEILAASFAFDVLFDGKPDCPSPRKVGADAWFDRRGADRYELREQTIRTDDDEVLTLLLIEDDQMLG